MIAGSVWLSRWGPFPAGPAMVVSAALVLSSITLVTSFPAAYAHDDDEALPGAYGTLQQTRDFLHPAIDLNNRPRPVVVHGPDVHR